METTQKIRQGTKDIILADLGVAKMDEAEIEEIRGGMPLPLFAGYLLIGTGIGFGSALLVDELK